MKHPTTVQYSVRLLIIYCLKRDFIQMLLFKEMMPRGLCDTPILLAVRNQTKNQVSR